MLRTLTVISYIRTETETCCRSSGPIVCAIALRQHQIACLEIGFGVPRTDGGSIAIDALVAKEINPVLFGQANRFIRTDNFFQCEDDALARVDQFFASTLIRPMILGARFVQGHAQWQTVLRAADINFIRPGFA